MRLPIPAVGADGSEYNDADIDAPKSGDMADARRDMETANVFQAMITLLTGSVRRIRSDGKTAEERPEIREVVKRMPYRSAEVLAIAAMLKIDPDDRFEGVYECPRCHTKQIAEETEYADQRDRVSDLEVTYAESYAPIELELQEPVQAHDKKSGELVIEIDRLTMDHPTLGVCAEAYNKYGARDRTRRQFAFYVDSLRSVNGEEITSKFRGEWGMYLFENLSIVRGGDLERLSEEVRRYGYDTTLEKHCAECGKRWRAPVDTSNFFASGLLSQRS